MNLMERLRRYDRIDWLLFFVIGCFSVVLVARFWLLLIDLHVL